MFVTAGFSKIKIAPMRWLLQGDSSTDSCIPCSEDKEGCLHGDVCRQPAGCYRARSISSEECVLEEGNLNVFRHACTLLRAYMYMRTHRKKTHTITINEHRAL